MNQMNMKMVVPAAAITMIVAAAVLAILTLNAIQERNDAWRIYRFCMAVLHGPNDAEYCKQQAFGDNP